jgi:hypothetical protein
VTAVIVDTGTLAKVIAYALVGGVGVSVVFALAVYCAIRSGDSRRAGRGASSSLYATLAAVAVACAAAAVVYGVVLTTQKS